MSTSTTLASEPAKTSTHEYIEVLLPLILTTAHTYGRTGHGPRSTPLQKGTP